MGVVVVVVSWKHAMFSCTPFNASQK
uniref:Uncharacterized protein n=1 Tax=Rhizophora mucronata TaxID=61149 RepID=A0A2P2NS77_RHIMU